MNYTGIVNLNLFPLGWVHFIASLAALAVGALVLLRTKGTSVHRRRGQIYALAVVASGITALGIYRQGGFMFAHWLGIAVAIVTLVGVAAAHWRIPRVGWVHLHLTCMLVSFYILIGGAVNEVFMRVGVLHRLVPNLDSPVVGTTHEVVRLVFYGLIAYFNVVIFIRSRAPQGNAAE
jgi:uncharacterized membrane protein